MRITEKKYDNQLDEMENLVSGAMNILKIVGNHMAYIENVNNGEEIVLDTHKLHTAIEELEKAREIAFNVEYSEFKEKEI